MKSQAEIKKEIAASKESADRLTEVGMKVVVTDDFGKTHETVTTSRPWALGHGHYICHTEKFRSYDCNRIRPLN